MRAIIDACSAGLWHVASPADADPPPPLPCTHAFWVVAAGGERMCWWLHWRVRTPGRGPSLELASSKSKSARYARERR